MPMVRAGTPYVLKRRRPRGMGQTSAYLQDPCDCFYPLPGVSNAITNPNNKPQCDPTTGLAPGCTQDEPPCEGIAYGQPGYAACYAAQGESAAASAQQAKNLAAMGLSYTPPAYAGPVPAVTTPAAANAQVGQSNAPSPAAVAKPSKAAAQSNAPSSVNMIPATVAAPACFSLFNGESCLGPIGATTALVLGGGLLGLFLLFRGHK